MILSDQQFGVLNPDREDERLESISGAKWIPDRVEQDAHEGLPSRLHLQIVGVEEVRELLEHDQDLHKVGFLQGPSYCQHAYVLDLLNLNQVGVVHKCIWLSIFDLVDDVVWCLETSNSNPEEGIGCKQDLPSRS